MLLYLSGVTDLLRKSEHYPEKRGDSMYKRFTCKCGVKPTCDTGACAGCQG
jgi:hypothetical protein